MNSAAVCAAIAKAVIGDRLHPSANGCAETQGSVGVGLALAAGLLSDVENTRGVSLLHAFKWESAPYFALQSRQVQEQPSID